MLARSPTAAAWVSENDYSSRLIENGVVLASTHRICGTWDGFIEQSVVPHHAKSARRRLERQDTREAAQSACEDFIASTRARDAAFHASEASTVPDSYQAGFASCAGH